MPDLHVPCLRLDQRADRYVYLFALPARDLLRVADVRRIRRQAGRLDGYQRGSLTRHVRDIADYLSGDDVVFPHGVLLALDGDVVFEAAREAFGTGAGSTAGVIVPGTLTIPAGSRARLVDGQQRMLALERAGEKHLPIPVSAFVPQGIDDERDQFVRLNSARPLPRRLLHELIPVLPQRLPERLERKRVPALLVAHLNTARESPFRGLIRQASSGAPRRDGPFVTDTSLLDTLDRSVHHPRGALFPYATECPEATREAAASLVVAYWQAVEVLFPEAWGRHPRESRLMHSLGIRAMGTLFDPAARLLRATEGTGSHAAFEGFVECLAPLRPVCAWTQGTWSVLGGIPWNALQNTPSHVSALVATLAAALYERPTRSIQPAQEAREALPTTGTQEPL